MIGWSSDLWLIPCVYMQNFILTYPFHLSLRILLSWEHVLGTFLGLEH